MATYSAGCSKVGSFNYAQYFTLYVQLSERDSDTSSNTSVVDYTVFCQSSGSGSINAKHYLYFNLGGNVYRDETVQVNVSSPNAYIGIASGSMTVNHNSDGTASLNFSAQIQASSYGVSASLSDTFTCSTIPRYFTSTPTIKCNSVTANSASMSWTTSENCSRVQYRIGSNGNWVDVESDANRKSGSYTISGLSAGTTYTIYGDYMRRDSGLWSQTKPSTTVTTLAYATVSQSLKSKTETSIVMNWSANATCDYLYYQIKKGNGSWSARTNYGSVNASSGTMTFNNLDPYTEYSIQIHVKRKDSQLISNYSSWTTTTTYAYPYANSMPNFTIGNRLTVGIYNPLNRSISIYAIAADNTEKGGDTTTGTSMAGFENASWQEFWYSSIPNAASGKYKIKVVYGSHTETRTGGTYSADSSTSRPTFGNWEYEDTNPVTLALTGNDQTVIKNYSTIRGLVSVANKSIPNKSASMSRYTFTIGNNSVLADYSGDSDVEMGDILATTSDMTMSATDSRNISTTVSKTPASFLEYFNIAIDKENSNLTRKNSISSETILTLKGTFWNYSFGEITNTIKTFTIEYKATNTEDDYTTVTSPSLTIEENEFSLNASIWGDLGADGFSPGGTFSVRITVGDELSESIYIITLGAGNPPMAIGKKGVAFGKPYDEALGNTVQINGNIVAQASDKSQMTSYNYNGITIGVEDTQNGKIASIGRSAIATVVRQFGQITKSAGFGITNDNPQASVSDGTNIAMLLATQLSFSSNGVSKGTVPITKVLYSNSTGTTGTVTLSETSANFSYLEIYYRGNSPGSLMTKVDSPNGKTASIMDGFQASNYQILQIGVEQIVISGTSITRANEVYANLTSTGVSAFGGVYTPFIIRKVVGYR